MPKRNIAILGSTGSIGTSALKLVEKFPHEFAIQGLSAGKNIPILAKQVKQFKPALVSTQTEEGKTQLQKLVGPLPGTEFVFGTSGAEAVASLEGVEIVLSAMVGAAGLRPTVAAIEAGKVIALANKESLVVAGAFVSQRAKETGATLLPVDSEHSAIFQALGGKSTQGVQRLILTASGGPFFLKHEMDLSKVTPEQALKHPNWSMGEKITIDSATLMNKGLEIVEARWLFDLPIEKIDAIVHPQSIIHSMVEYVDGSMIAQLSVPDMTGPIAYALHYPHRMEGVMKRLPLSEIGQFQFYDLDHERFPSINLARKAVALGETFPAVLNGSNEITVRAFLEKKIGFLDIVLINQKVLQSYKQKSCNSLEDYIQADEWGRKEAEKQVHQR